MAHYGVRKDSASQPSEMRVLNEGNKIASRPSSVGLPKQNTKKIASEGLIVLPPDFPNMLWGRLNVDKLCLKALKEPGAVKFENVTMCTPPGVCSESPCGGRVGSAGRVERSLQLTRKKETDFDLPRRNSADGQIENSVIQSVNRAQVKSSEELKPILGPHARSSHTEKKEDSESASGDSSDSDDADVDEGQATVTNGVGAQDNKVEASVELKGEFLKAVMDEDYEKAKELCQKILLLEPDNKTCSEFHAVIVKKMKQDVQDALLEKYMKIEEEGSDDDESDDDESDDSEDDDEEDDEDEESDDESSDDHDDDDEDETDSDDDFTLPLGPINLIMGGLPIRPQSR